MLSQEERKLTADSIKSCQTREGLVLWHEGGHADPWNHVEALIALALEGERECSERGYYWLIANQATRGYWWNYYWASTPKDFRIDTNTCTYIGLGALVQYMVYRDKGFLEEVFPAIDKAINFVLSLKWADGSIPWCVEPNGRLGKYALVTGSSSILLSIRAALNICEILGLERPEWELAGGELKSALRRKSEAFANKDNFAMDWYYPILAGAIDGEQAVERLNFAMRDFFIRGFGIKCVSENDWVTAAETAEWSITLKALGQEMSSREMLSLTRLHRLEDGSYYTGLVIPQMHTFPVGEKSSYSAAAILIALHALYPELSTYPEAGQIIIGKGLYKIAEFDSVDAEQPSEAIR